MDALGQLIGTGTVTLLVALVLFQITQGGRRGRLRRELLEDLDLEGKLDSRPAVRDRLQRSIDARLERYAPSPIDEALRGGSVRKRWAIGVTAVVGLLGAVGIVELLGPDLTFIENVVAGGTLGIVLATGLQAAQRWSDNRVDFVAVFEEALTEDSKADVGKDADPND